MEKNEKNSHSLVSPYVGKILLLIFCFSLKNVCQRKEREKKSMLTV